MDLKSSFNQHDPELVQYFPFILKLSFWHMIRVYDEHKRGDMKSLNPELLEIEEKELEKIYEEMQITMVDDLFDETKDLDNETFIKRLSTPKFSKYLEPFELRRMVFEKTLEDKSRI